MGVKRGFDCESFHTAHTLESSIHLLGLNKGEWRPPRDYAWHDLGAWQALVTNVFRVQSGSHPGCSYSRHV